MGFFSTKVQTTQPAASDSALPGISQMKTQVPVKVTTMHLGASPLWNGGVLYDDSAQDAIQRGNDHYMKIHIFKKILLDSNDRLK